MYRADPESYERYFLNQAGSGFPVFHGAEFQRGHGLASIFSSIGKKVLPLLKRSGKAIAHQAIRSGSEFLGDVLEGRNAKQSVINRSKEAGSSLLHSMMSGSNKKRKRPSKPIRSKKTKRRKTNRDIFS